MCAVVFKRMCTPLLHRRKNNKMAGADENLVSETFDKYADNGKMGAEGLLRFLHEEQGEGKATLEDANNLLQQQRKEISKLPKLRSQDMKMDDFFQFLVNPRLNGPITTQVYQDMTRPLAEYYIFTGHNSYLTGNQLSSESSDAPIVAALRRGVRVVELDLWPDTKKKGMIKVTHGNTLTEPVDFEKCITSIKENAFVASQYPVCITLEDHLSSELQAQAASILLRVLGEALFYPPTDEPCKEFPSPESLKGRIIISTKPPKEYLEAPPVGDKAAAKALAKEDKQDAKQSSPLKEETLSEKVEKFHIDQGHSATPPNAGPAAESVPQHPHDEDIEEEDREMHKNSEYARLITIRQVKPVKGTIMKDRLSVEETVKRISLAESKLDEVAEENPELLVNFTKRNILRIYPSGVRVDSSNYDPVIAWVHGAQMVALNMQGYGKCLWKAHGFFKANGGCGYIHKPKFLLENDANGATFNPKLHHAVKEIFKVKVIMTLGWKEAFSKRHFDLFSPPDFFVKLIIEGAPADKKKHKTAPAEDQWVPTWNEEFEFSLRVPELALMRIEVRDEDDESKDEFEGQTCLPVFEIKNGYRCVQLYDKKGNELPGVRLLFHFERTPSPVS